MPVHDMTESKSADKHGEVNSSNGLTTKKAIPRIFGADTHMATGYNVLTGSPETARTHRVFDFDFDTSSTVDNRADYAHPSKMTIHPEYKCQMWAIQESEITTNFESSLEIQAKSFNGGYEKEVDIKLGVEYKGASAEASTTLQNSVMFGTSSESRNYKSRYEYQETQAFSAETKASSHVLILSVASVTEEDFNEAFVRAAKGLGANPSFDAVMAFYDEYGTHVISEATFGGRERRSAYYGADVSEDIVMDARRKTTDSGVNLLGLGFGKTEESYSEGYRVDTNNYQYYTSNRYLEGGISSETEGEYCNAIFEMRHLTVVQRELHPIFELVTRISGVANSTAQKLKEHLTAVLDPVDADGQPLRCEWDSDAICTWDHVAKQHDCRSACVCTVEEGPGDFNVEDPCRKLPPAKPKVHYGEGLNLRVTSLSNRWLTGARDKKSNERAGDKVYSQNMYHGAFSNSQETFKWILRSNAGNGQANHPLNVDPKASECVRYGDLVYLQVMDVNDNLRWLSGGRTKGNDVVRAYNMLARGEGSPERGGDGSYKWTVRSTPGSGPRGFIDPRNGQCVSLNDMVYFQVNNLDNRWLTGGRDSGNENVWTRDGTGDPSWTGGPSYLWEIQKAVQI